MNEHVAKPASSNGPYTDLRDLLQRVDAIGELKRISGADWNLEMGCLAELIYHAAGESAPPALLFDDIPGYPGFRCLAGMTNSAQRLAMTMGFPLSKKSLDVVTSYRDRMQGYKPIPPREVASGPIFENIIRDEDVNVYKFPVPMLHELDGGRYIATDDLVIMRDPENDWVNIGTYRSMVQDEKSVGLWMSPGKHGRQIREKYFKMGKPCPVLISCGHDPLLFLAAGNELKFGFSEYDYAGGHRGEPIEVVKSELHGLPMPAHAEIVLEGEMYPGETLPEGPFGEFTGYYNRERSEQPVVRIRRIYHRDNPIMSIASPIRPPSDFSYSKCVMKAGMIWDEVERAGLSGVRGVWCHEAGAARMLNIISIKQAFAGHARQALHLAASCQSASYLGRWVIVVDHDVDPTDTFDVLWAMSTRADPATDIEVMHRAWSGPLDPLVKDNMNSRGLIDACRPFERLDSFPPISQASPELKARVAEKFKHLL